MSKSTTRRTTTAIALTAAFVVAPATRAAEGVVHLSSLRAAAGDACQCGDLDEDADVDADDLDIARRHLMPTPIGVPYEIERCNVIGPSDKGLTDCNVADFAILQRIASGESAPLGDLCETYRPTP